MTSLQAQIKAARAAVNRETFGTPEWEAAMEIVRRLTRIEMAQMPKFEHTSIDGDIWAPK